MTDITFNSLVWLTYRLGATFAFGLPLILFIWAFREKEYSIVRLLSIYWKVASLMPISMLLLTGNRSIGYLTSFISSILLIASVWFWIDLNEELRELPNRKPLPFVVKSWRWAISFFGLLFMILSYISLQCINNFNTEYCNVWKDVPQNFHQIAKYLFNFLFGASWTEPLAAFIGYLALITYFIGLLQWVLMRFPKQGRIAGGF